MHFGYILLRARMGLLMCYLSTYILSINCINNRRVVVGFYIIRLVCTYSHLGSVGLPIKSILNHTASKY